MGIFLPQGKLEALDKEQFISQKCRGLPPIYPQEKKPFIIAALKLQGQLLFPQEKHCTSLLTGFFLTFALWIGEYIPTLLNVSQKTSSQPHSEEKQAVACTALQSILHKGKDREERRDWQDTSAVKEMSSNRQQKVLSAVLVDLVCDSLEDPKRKLSA